MRINTINLQIVRNLGNYETLRIGAEWTPDSNQTLAEAMAAGMAELNETADILTGKKAAQAAVQSNNPVAQAVAEGNSEKVAKELDKALTEQQAPGFVDALDEMNDEKEGDAREVVTLAKAAKFNNVLGRLAAGVDVETIFKYYRFDEDTLAIFRAAIDGQRVTLTFGDKAFEQLIKAIEGQKNISNICGFIQFADQNTANAWELAIKMCNK